MALCHSSQNPKGLRQPGKDSKSKGEGCRLLWLVCSRGRVLWELRSGMSQEPSLSHSNQYQYKALEHFGNKLDIFHSHKTLNHKSLQCKAVQITWSFSFEGTDWVGRCGNSLGGLVRRWGFVSPAFTLHLVRKWAHLLLDLSTVSHVWCLVWFFSLGLPVGNRSPCPRGIQSEVYFSFVPTGTQHHAWKSD